MTSPVDISPDAVDNAASYIEEEFPHAARMMRALRSSLTARAERIAALEAGLEEAIEIMLQGEQLLPPGETRFRAILAKGETK